MHQMRLAAGTAAEVLIQAAESSWQAPKKLNQPHCSAKRRCFAKQCPSSHS